MSRGHQDRQARGEAEAQLPVDKAAVQNCDIWGPICDKAKNNQRATEKKLADARALFKTNGILVGMRPESRP